MAAFGSTYQAASAVPGNNAAEPPDHDLDGFEGYYGNLTLNGTQVNVSIGGDVNGNDTVGGFPADVIVGGFPGNVSWPGFPGNGSVEGLSGPPAFPPLPPGVEQLQMTVRMLHLYFPPVAFPLGIVLNLVSMVILCKPVFSHLSSSQYLLGLLITDTVHLLWILHQWLTIKAVPVYFVGGWCQFVTFTKGVVDFLTVWLAVGVGVDRFLATCFPEREQELCTACRARVAILGLFFVAMVVNLNTSLLSGLVPVYHNTVICTTIPAFQSTVATLSHIDVFVNGALPSCLLTVLTLGTLGSLLRDYYADRRWLLCQGRYSSTPTQSRTPRHGTAAERIADIAERQQTRAAVVLVFVFLLLSVPYHVHRVWEASRTIRYPGTHTPLRTYLIQEILQHVVRVRLGLTFWILIVFNNVFRKMFTDALCYCVGTCLLIRRRRRGVPVSLMASFEVPLRDEHCIDMVCEDREEEGVIQKNSGV